MQHDQPVCFGPYHLDVANAQLRRGHQALRLTNKAFAVLRYLVEHPGQLVKKETFFQAVWPETVVTETTLTNCIGELRKVLGDDPKKPQFIETVHRRGYRFLASVATAPPVQSSQFTVQSQNEARSSLPQTSELNPLASSFVGREAELAQLHGLFAKALSGQRQVVFVTGEAGIGKTALIEAFLVPG